MDSPESGIPTLSIMNESTFLEENADSVATFQEKIFRTAVWCVFGFGGVAFWALFLLQNQQLNTILLTTTILVFAGLLVVAFLTRISYHYRVASLILLLYLQGATCLFALQLLSAATLYLFSGLILTPLLMNKKVAYFMGFVSLLTLLLGSYGLPATLASDIQVFRPEINSLLFGLIYSLIAAVGIIPLLHARTLLRFNINANQQPDDESGDLKESLASTTADLPPLVDERLTRIERIGHLIAHLNLTRPWDEILLQALSWINQEYGYTRIEILLETSETTYQHVSLTIKSEGAIEKNAKLIHAEEAPEIIRKFMSQPPETKETDSNSDGVLDVSIETGDLHSYEIFIPLKSNQEMIGAILIHPSPERTIIPADLIELELLADHLASTLLNKKLVGDEIALENPRWVNQAIYRLISSETDTEIFSILDDTLRHSSFVTIQFQIEKNSMRLNALNDPDNPNQAHLSPLTVPIESGEGIIPDTPLMMRQLFRQSRLPSELLKLLHQLNLDSAAFLPIQPNNQIQRLIIIGSRQKDHLTPTAIQPYVYLSGYATTAIEKIITRQHLNRRVVALQSLASISQVISVVTDLNELFDTIHEQVSQVVGEVDLAIALYDPLTDMISIPYAYEAGEKLTLEPFPLGQGLTSILIRTQQPLLLVKDTERRARELGAKISGAAAKSWLGVPLIVSGEVLGAIILQDTEHEQRFTEDDLHLITTLASQVAITVRNVRLLQETNQRAEQERIISSITSKIWSSPDIETIARNALLELGRALKASEGTILLQKSTPQEILMDHQDTGMKSVQ